jgi:glutamate--cysteine ligase
MIPHLTATHASLLQELESRILAKSAEIEHWFRGQWLDRTPPFYTSVDLRNSGFKVAPVDTNLFPGGFNNLNPAFQALCVQAVSSTIDRTCPNASNLLLIPENHTRNPFYMQNVARLVTIFRQAGLNVRIGSLLPSITEPTTVEVPGQPPLVLEPLVRSGQRIGVKDFEPCLVVLNNDMSAGVPEILRDLDDSLVVPPLHAGWTVRRKSNHFNAYDQVAADFAKLLSIDPWLVNPYHAHCGQVSFHERTGEECLAANVGEMLDQIRAKYLEYGIKDDPFVVVKADAGTYGMGIMMAKSVDDVVGLNRKQRNKMAVVKEGLEVHDVIIQEGVHTYERIDGAVGEPVVYMIDRHVVGGFYRVHTGRGIDENLNAPGMHFVPIAFNDCCIQPDFSAQPDAEANRFYAYGIIARLALAAAALELEQTAPSA